MADKAARGTKRTCQNEECGIKFYDLNRDPIVCPDCETVYKLTKAEEEELTPVVAAAPVAVAEKAPATSDGDEVDDEDDALVSLEDADAELGNDDDSDDDDDGPFLETDDDDNGVGDIIGGV